MPKPSAEKPSAGPSRRPSSSRRTSSHDKKPASSISSSKHGLTGAPGHAATEGASVKMSHSSTGVTSPDTSREDFPAVEHGDSSSGKSKFGKKSADDSVTMEQERSRGAAISDMLERVSLSGAARPQETARASKGSEEEIERLKDAVNAQMKLNQQREKLTQLIERERQTSQVQKAVGKSRVSPINEEATQAASVNTEFVSQTPTALNTASTESVKTIRDGITPAANLPGTPSYPFPSMKTPRQLSFGGHRPFTSLSPTVAPTNYGNESSFESSQDRMMSGSATPASAANFLPSETYPARGDTEFPSPNLYDLSLLLTAEPGLDPWWTTVVTIMHDFYNADRVTLAVPADSTDIENVPWGQKATFNVLEDDDLSLTYLPRGSSLVQSSGGTNETSNSENTNPSEISAPFSPSVESVRRPSLANRHSYTAFEDTKKGPTSVVESSRPTAMRREPLSRSKSYAHTRVEQAPRSGTLQNAELTLQSLEQHLDLQEDDTSPDWETAAASIRQTRGRMFPVLQALDYEVDPLIDRSGVIRVLERGKVVALTRDYPYLDAQDEASGGTESSQASKSSQRSNKIESPSGEKGKKTKPAMSTRMSSFLGSSKGSRRPSRNARSQTSEKGKIIPDTSHPYEDPLPANSRYEEYEQAPPSPWAQSPAPSPAVRADPSDNPFFADAAVDEESFNPTATTEDYSKVHTVEAIGVDRSCTVLHIPLSHVLLSKPVQSFRLDAAAMESKAGGAGKGLQAQKGSDTSKIQSTSKKPEKQRPIAILSIISPVIPYPSSLRHSLQRLAPHLATSFSLCRHYTNLETEIAGLSRKRPHITGFGGLPTAGRLSHPQTNPGEFFYSLTEDASHQRSMGGSMTSPSEYSGLSRSALGSPVGSPGWDPGSVGLSVDRRSAGGSPGYAPGDSYFGSKSRPGLGRAHTGSTASLFGAYDISLKDKSLSEARQPQRAEEQIPAGVDRLEKVDMTKGSSESLSEDTSVVAPGSKLSRAERLQRDTTAESSQVQDSSATNQAGDNTLSPRRLARSASTQGVNRSDRAHTQLHSYGADFAATFQSLPTTTFAPERSLGGQIQNLAQHVRSGSLSNPPEMPPPSDRLKTLMLDSLPAHLFVALPQTGEIVWVNSRYLTYRGQTVSELRKDPFGNIHEDERDEFIKNWAHAVRTGEQFSMQVRIRRFDGNFRWFYTRAVGGRDTRGVIVQWYGSYMDIHDQHIAEVKAARQEEVEASEAKHRLLANLIPQIIFAATEDEGVTFANEQWLSYTGQKFDDALGLGFIDYVHPEDLAKCQIPTDVLPIPSSKTKKRERPSRFPSQSSSGGKSSSTSGKSSAVSEAPTETTVKGMHQALSRHNSSSSESVYELPTADLSELARSGVIKISTDGDGRSSYTTEIRLRSKTGEYRWHLVRCVEVDNINFGSGDGSWFGACTDINDQKLLETKLKEAMESKSKFLSNMSHEIRTPIIGISGMVSFLQDTVLNDEQIDYTNTIQTSANSLLSIINDILDLSKVDAGMMKLSYEWFHARSVIEEVNELVSTMAISKRLELNYVVDEDVPSMLKGDRVRIRQVLLNVIGNAIKFTTEGEVFSRCRVFHDESANVAENEIMLEYSIVDTGTGFTKEEAELIFKPFSQIDGSSTRQHGGSGLGLVISRQLVELHGGTMHGTAVPGVGSTFVFTAKFGLPTETDHPEMPTTPMFSKPPSTRSSVSVDVTTRAIKSAGGNPLAAYKYISNSSPAISPRTDTGPESPAVASSGSSDPSIRSFRTHLTGRSSMSSVNASLAHFGEAARASGENLTMNLAIPQKISPGITPTQDLPLPSKFGDGNESSDLKHFRPPMYSILIICPQKHSREATTKHIEMTLPPDVPYKITALANVLESQKMIGGDNPVIFTHIVLNLNLADDVVALIDQIFRSGSLSETSIVILSDPVQRQAVLKIALEYSHDQLAQDNRVSFIYKPVKPSRFAVIFDPDMERDLSTDRNRFTAQQHVADQKQNYLDVEKRLGNKGLKVLLVEDNLVNQKVLLKFLSKVGIGVDMALDGVECTEMVFAKPHNFYSLILCDLHMPRKDGYQTCREIRAWEKANHFPRMPLIALSANVMADVLHKCVAAGFNSYVTKPVDFKALSTAMSDLLDPIDLTEPLKLMLPVE